MKKNQPKSEKEDHQKPSPHEHKGHRDRMRQRFLKSDERLSGFAPHEILELLLFYGIPRVNVNPLAHQLLKRFGSLNAVLSASVEELQEIDGISKSGAVFIALMRRTMNYVSLERLGEKPYMRNLKECKAYCSVLFSDADEERFYVICLDAQNRVLNAVLLFTGTINEVAVYPREVIGKVIRLNAYYVVLAHNHPSGILEPSNADLHMTDLLREAFSNVDIRLQDHIIYADGQCLSLTQWKKELEQQRLPKPRAKAADKES